MSNIYSKKDAHIIINYSIEYIKQSLWSFFKNGKIADALKNSIEFEDFIDAILNITDKLHNQYTRTEPYTDSIETSLTYEGKPEFSDYYMYIMLNLEYVLDKNSLPIVYKSFIKAKTSSARF